MVDPNPSSAQLLRFVQRMPIEVPRMSMVALVREACIHYNTLNPSKRPAGPYSDNEFLARLCVNYLRHATTRYDRNRDTLRALTSTPADREQIGNLIKARTLVAIARTYPSLTAEARRQAVRTDESARNRGAR